MVDGAQLLGEVDPVVLVSVPVCRESLRLRYERGHVHEVIGVVVRIHALDDIQHVGDRLMFNMIEAAVVPVVIVEITEDHQAL